MKVLFFLPYSKEAAGCRYRVHQFVPFLERQGVRCELRELIKPDVFRLLYEPGHGLRKAANLLWGAVERGIDLRDAAAYDVLFVYRECYPFGPPLLESLLSRTGRPIVYDFDDAIYLPSGNALKDLVRRPQKTTAIAHLASEVIVCNDSLRQLCLAYNPNVTVIPTSVDTDALFLPRSYAEPAPQPKPVRLGWIGSHSTAHYLHELAAPLQRLASRYSIEVLVVGAGREVRIPGVKVINEEWSLSTEVERFRSLDIGLYPLKDGLWERGKPSFKTIQYMAVGVPAVVSSVGSARDVVQDGVNGFLVQTEDQWVDRIASLIDDPSLRRRMGEAGRSTALQAYSVASNGPKLLRVLQRAAGG
jgi:glycosyltransferase involved in cell wall biosynthesis